MKSKRIGDIEIIKIGKIIEIIKWQPNCFFGKENEYDQLDSETFRNKINPHYIVHSSCFLNNETCYVLANFENGNLKFIGDRPFQLTEKDFNDFIKITRQKTEEFNKWKNK